MASQYRSIYFWPFLRFSLGCVDLSVKDYTIGAKSKEIHEKGLMGVKHRIELLSKGYKIGVYRPDFLLITPPNKSHQLGFRVAWCEVVRTHPPSRKKIEFLKEFLGEEAGLILMPQNKRTWTMRIEQFNKQTRTASFDELIDR
jgi:hypothetical protein